MNTGVCTACKSREPFFSRPYSGEILCRRCFTTSIEDKVRVTLGKYNMLKHDERIAVAVSGGKDSVSLLHILSKIEKKYPKSTLIAVTVDEGIRRYRDEALKIAAQNCEKLSVLHYSISFKEIYGYTLDELVAKLEEKERKKLTPCAYCGVLRRKALNIAARSVRADKLATGHTLDDETQTILLNILHGDPLRIAREKPVTDPRHPKLVQRIKPFCEIPERETTLYAYVKKIAFQDLPCPHASAALRNDIRAFLNRMEEKHSGMKFTLFRSAEKIRAAIEKAVETHELRECRRCGEPTPSITCSACQILAEL